ncbi:MAG: FAD-binding oxidoreductase [Alphaproteobacteria bacterium]|jgi:decaprenylphospho-beta-D-ribofuranose 2-oxidase
MRWDDAVLTTWGRSRFAHVDAAAPSDDAGVAEALRTAHPRGIIAYGGGRCYGDAALDDGGQALMTRALDRVLSFDAATGQIVCEAGVTFAQLVREYIPQGWCFPVSAATASVTVGGAFANDIHSKNHHAVGSFGDHVDWIELMLADGAVKRCSRNEEAELFRASLGGIGLTGIVLRVAFRLMRVPSGAADARYVPIANVDAMIDMIEAERPRAGFLFGWTDVMAHGNALGRGILEIGNLADSEDGMAPPAPQKRVPFDLPVLAMHPAVLRRFNARRIAKLPPDGRQVRLPLDRFFFPLDSIAGFNRVYGRRGFYSIHTGFPLATMRAGIRAVIEEISVTGAGSFAAVMKPMGGAGAGLLSFPVEGMAFAVDLPRRRGIEALHKRLETLTLDHGGRLYVAKDALMAAGTYAAMFPNLDEFRAVLARVDPQGRFQSDMSRRLRLRPLADA